LGHSVHAFNQQVKYIPMGNSRNSFKYLFEFFNYEVKFIEKV